METSKTEHLEKREENESVRWRCRL